MNSEVWRPVVGFEKRYEVSSFGRIRANWISRRRGRQIKMMTPTVDPSGYVRIQFFKKGKCKSVWVHRVVAMAFLGIPEDKKECNHINGIRSDNHISNLEWTTSSGNKIHAMRFGRMARERDVNGRFVRAMEATCQR